METWLARYRYLHWSDKVLVFTGLMVIATIIGLSSWLAILPPAVEPATTLPRYASVKTGGNRMPINLPMPAAGQNKVTVPLSLPKRPTQRIDERSDQSPVTPSTQRIREPLDKLTEFSDGFTLPVVAADGTTPFDAYRSRFVVADDDDRARIALITTGIGLNSKRSDTAYASMPSEISVAVSPYARTAQSWVNQAFEQGRDVLLMVPMEPNSFPTIDPGPDTLMRDAPAAQNIQKLHTVMSKMRGYCGLLNDTGSRFTANEVALGPVLDDVAKRGLMVVDARASAYTVLGAQAKKRGIPVAVNTRFIDNSLRPDDIDRQLRDLERTAMTVGTAVGLMRDFPITLARVKAWQATLDETQFLLTPISAVANTQPIR